MGSYRSEEVELLLQVARDASLGRTFRERMDAVTETLSALIPNTSLSAVVIQMTPDGLAAGRHAYFRNGDLQWVRTYADEYARFDPSQEAGRARPGVPMTLSELVPSGKFGADPFTGEFLPQYGIKHILGFIEHMPDGLCLSFAVHRERRLRDFRPRERELLGLAVPDIARAAFGAMLREKVDDLGRQATAGVEPAAGAILFDARGDVLHVDSGARALCRRLAGEFPADDVVGAVRRLGTSPVAAEGAESRLTLQLDDGSWAQLRLSCLTTGAGGNVLGVIEVLRPGTAALFDALADRAGLTPREREVAALAVQGLGSQEIAFRLGAAAATIAVHLSKVYAKTGAPGRVELVRHMLGATEAPPLPPARR